MVWEMNNQGKMILSTMNEMIKAIKDEKPTPDAYAASATGLEIPVHWPFGENETDVSNTDAQARLNGISTPDLTPAQLELRGVYRMRAWIRDGIQADEFSPEWIETNEKAEDVRGGGNEVQDSMGQVKKNNWYIKPSKPNGLIIFTMHNYLNPFHFSKGIAWVSNEMRWDAKIN